MKEKIIELLRCGRFTQIAGRLHGGDDKRCAVGVICEALGLKAERDGNRGMTFEGCVSCIPLTVLKSCDKLQLSRIMVDNDSGMSFEAIAVRLEKEHYDTNRR